jgi:4-hydroxybutyrate CoA-transferase
VPSDQDAGAARLLAGLTEAVVLAGMWPQQPDALLAGLIDRARRDDVTLTVLFADLEGSLAFLDERAERDLVEGRLRLVSVAGTLPRRLSRFVDYVPQSLWDVDRLIGSGILRVDVVVARVVAEGPTASTAALGDMVGYTPAALGTDARVGLEVVVGAAPGNGVTVPLARADVVMPGQPRPERARPTASTEQAAIGRAVAALVPDGATLQLGLGAVPEATVPYLAGKSDLGLHSGILTPAVGELIVDGTMTGRRKTRDPGLHVATGILDRGSTRYEGLSLRPVSETHAPGVLLATERLWAINSAFEIDLAGQANAEFVGGVRVASGGGQADFVRGAHASLDGAAVLALPARSRRGQARVVAELSAPHVPTSPGSEIDIVVTEHGTADLRGRTAGERATALIAVAHPEDREALRRALADRAGP